ncbi:MAG: hypothetical protein ACO1OT_08875 [Heyndrickxia sp.]
MMKTTELRRKRRELLIKTAELMMKIEELLMKTAELKGKTAELLMKPTELKGKTAELMVKPTELKEKHQRDATIKIKIPHPLQMGNQIYLPTSLLHSRNLSLISKFAETNTA